MALIVEQSHPLEFILSEANSWRSRERALIAIGANILPPGTIIKAQLPVTDPPTWSPVAPGEEAEAVAITLYGVDPRVDEQEVAVLARDAEVNEAYLRWTADPAAIPPAGDLDRTAVNVALGNVGIIVRPGIFPSSEVVMGITQPPSILP
jgi:Bacteriophage lambda head decoration protein D